MTPNPKRDLFLNRWREYHEPPLGRAVSEFDTVQRELIQSLKSGEFQRGIGAALDCVTSGARLLGYQVAATGAMPNLTLLRKIVAYGGLGWGALHAHFEREGIPAFGPTGHEKSIVWLYCLAKVCGINSLSDWLGRYIYNLFIRGIIDGAPGDATFNSFTWMLVRAVDKREWPSEDELPADIGIYRGLFTSADSISMSNAAAAICEGVESARLDGKLNADGEHSIYEYDPWGLFPLDILALCLVREQITGAYFSPGSTHTLLEPPFVSFPTLSESYEDDLTSLLTAECEKRFGKGWQPWPQLPRLEPQ